MKKLALKTSVLLFTLILIISSCGSTKKAINISEEEKTTFNQKEGDTIQISSDKTEYDIIIIEPGFNTWLVSIAKPEGFYSQSYFENRNQLYVSEWNRRVMQPTRYDTNLYELRIDYNSTIDYGYEVNYKLFNYFIYFQRKYNQRLGPFVPRI